MIAWWSQSWRFIDPPFPLHFPLSSPFVHSRKPPPRPPPVINGSFNYVFPVIMCNLIIFKPSQLFYRLQPCSLRIVFSTLFRWSPCQCYWYGTYTSPPYPPLSPPYFRPFHAHWLPRASGIKAFESRNLGQISHELFFSKFICFARFSGIPDE